MEKFIKIPVTSEPDQLIRVSNVLGVERVSATVTVIHYLGGITTRSTAAVTANPQVTFTHASDSGSVGAMVTFVNDNVQAALATSWTNPVAAKTPPLAVSGLAHTVAV
jgi:hypothetical protein